MLFIGINIIIDIAIHIVTDNNLGKPDTFRDAFTILEKEKFLSSDEANIYRSMVGLRNILAHEYLKVNKEMIYEVLQNRVVDMQKFIIFVNEYFL